MFLSHHQAGIDSVKSGNDASFMCFSLEFGVLVPAPRTAPELGTHLPFASAHQNLRVTICSKSTNIWINKGCRAVICIRALNPLLGEGPGKHTIYSIRFAWKDRESF